MAQVPFSKLGILLTGGKDDLPEMPLEFWNEDVFVGLASTFGELLSIDSITASKCCLNFSRMYIGVREGTYMPVFMAFHSKLGVHNQKLVYETITFTYFLCLKADHKENQCPKVDKQKLKDPDTLDISKDLPHPPCPMAKGKKKLIWRCKTSKASATQDSKVEKQQSPRQNGSLQEDPKKDPKEDPLVEGPMEVELELNGEELETPYPLASLRIVTPCSNGRQVSPQKTRPEDPQTYPLGSGFDNLEAKPVVKGLEEKILKLINNSSLDQIAHWEEWIDSYSLDSLDDWNMKKNITRRTNLVISPLFPE